MGRNRDSRLTKEALEDIKNGRTYLFNGDCRDIMLGKEFTQLTEGRNIVIVTDPPFNIGYHYKMYRDNLDEDTYYSILEQVFGNYPFVVIHYPESIYKISFQVGRFPDKVVSWVYNSNTAKQHRDIAFFDVQPNFKQVRQPYKNQNDKRIQKLMAAGHVGGRLYDWWNINQVKNVSKDKTGHPCQMPLDVMKNIIGILPADKNYIVVDPFMGSGTTGLACAEYGLDFIGIELDPSYYDICLQRLMQTSPMAQPS